MDLGTPTRPEEEDVTTVADVMLRRPKILPARATVGEVRELFGSDHVHMALLTDDDSLLVSTLDRHDLPSGLADEDPAAPHGTLDGRVVRVDERADGVRLRLLDSGRRRVAVVDGAGHLQGLLCLKHHGRGFCGVGDVEGRRAGRAPAVDGRDDGG